MDAQTPGILIVSDPFNKNQPGSTPQQVGGSDKPLVYTSVTPVTAGGPNELTLQLGENVEVSRVRECLIEPYTHTYTHTYTHVCTYI